MNCWIWLLLLFCGNGNSCGNRCVRDCGCDRRKDCCECKPKCECECECKPVKEPCCEKPVMPPPPMADFGCKYNDDCDCQN